MDLCTTNNALHERLCCAGNYCNSETLKTDPSSGSCSYHLTLKELPNLFDTCNNNNNNTLCEMKRTAPCTETETRASKVAHQSSPSVHTELQKSSAKKQQQQSEPPEVFLGGSCNPTTWRQELAIPMLEKLGVTYYNPQVSDWNPSLMELEHKAKQNAHVNFYVLDSMTRSIAVMNEVAFMLAQKIPLVLVITGFKGPGSPIYNEPLSITEYEELIGGQKVLEELVEFHGVPVFNDIQTAVKCTAKVIHEKVKPTDLKLEDINEDGHLQIGNKLINIKKTFETLDVYRKGEVSLSDVAWAYRMTTNEELTRSKLKIFATEEPKSSKNKDTFSNGLKSVKLNLDQFFSIMNYLLRPSAFKSTANGALKSVCSTISKLIDVIPDDKNSEENGESSSQSKQINGSTSANKNTRKHVYIETLDKEWLSQVAIPLLKKHGITYLTPEDELCSSKKCKSYFSHTNELISRCRLAFFHITSSARSLQSMIMACYHAGAGTNLIISSEPLAEDAVINGEKLSKVAVKDYNRGRSYLSDMSGRTGVTVFQNTEKALDHLIEHCKNFNNEASNS